MCPYSRTAECQLERKWLQIAIDTTHDPQLLQHASEGFKMLQNASTSLNMLENASERHEITIMYPFGRTAGIHCLGVEHTYAWRNNYNDGS